MKGTKEERSFKLNTSFQIPGLLYLPVKNNCTLNVALYLVFIMFEGTTKYPSSKDSDENIDVVYKISGKNRAVEAHSNSIPL